MTHVESVAVTAQATFGRDGAMFESLLAFVAQLSLVLWGLVTLTAVIRFVGIRTYRRGAARTAHVKAAVVPSTVAAAAVMPAAAAEIDLVRVAAGQLTDDGLVRLGLFGSTTSVKVPRHAARHRRAGPRSAARVRTLAANSTEA